MTQHGFTESGVFCAFHPSEGSGDLAVVLCPPLGHEYTHSHRSMRALAEAIVQAGLACLRFDYRGTGNSMELPPRSGSALPAWREDVSSALHEVLRLSGCKRVALVGLRAGALLAARAEGAEITARVLWHSPTSPKRYVRELQAIAATSAAAAAAAVTPDPSRPTPSLHAAGFAYTPETLVELASLAEVPIDPATTLTLSGQEAPGYEAMMAEPQFTEVPHAAIARIVSWLAAHASQAASQSTRPPRLQPFFEIAPGIRETVASPAAGLFGILCEPTRPTPAPTLLILNSGSVHHVGPHGLYTELARALAHAGLASLRIDLRGLGESPALPGRPPNLPYPPEAQDDVARALAWLEARTPSQPIVALGLCSGAHAAFKAAVHQPLPALRAAFLINPLTYHWVEGMSLETGVTRNFQEVAYYRSSLRNPAKWGALPKKLLRGELHLTALARTLLKRLTARTSSPQLVSDLRAAKARSRTLHLFVARQDPGYDLLIAGAKREALNGLSAGRIRLTWIDGADHTFTPAGPRAALIDHVVASARALA